MTQVSKYFVSKDVQKRMREIFLDALVDIKTRREAEDFINDFFTHTEQVMLPKRLTIAFLLRKRFDHRAISRFLRVSFTTINRVGIAFKTGGGGYTRVISRILANESLSAVFEKIEDSIVSLIGPHGPGSSNWRQWYTERRRQKLADRKPF